MSKKEKLQLQVLTAVVAGVVSVSIGGDIATPPWLLKARML